jgi:hypothetical protein
MKAVDLGPTALGIQFAPGPELRDVAARAKEPALGREDHRPDPAIGGPADRLVDRLVELGREGSASACVQVSHDQAVAAVLDPGHVHVESSQSVCGTMPQGNGQGTWPSGRFRVKSRNMTDPAEPFRRYALYHLPDGDAGRIGAGWLGHDPRSSAPPTPGAVSPLVSRPRRYGFHATVVAPFALASGQSRAALEKTVADFCRAQVAVADVTLGLTTLGRFLALVPDDQTRLSKLATEALRSLEPFRAPLSEAELISRGRDRLDPDRRALLERWGYPHVLHRFRWHYTLTGPLADPGSVRDRVAQVFAPLLAARQSVAHLSLVGEDAQGDFRALATFALGTGDAVHPAHPCP